MVTLVVIGSHVTFLKRLEKGLEDLEIRGQVEIIQNVVLLRSARIQKKSARDLIFVITQN